MLAYFLLGFLYFSSRTQERLPLLRPPATLVPLALHRWMVPATRWSSRCHPSRFWALDRPSGSGSWAAAPRGSTSKAIKHWDALAGKKSWNVGHQLASFVLKIFLRVFLGWSSLLGPFSQSSQSKILILSQDVQQLLGFQLNTTNNGI